MIHPKLLFSFTASALLFFSMVVPQAIAQSYSELLQPYLTEDVVAMAYVDLEAIDLDAALTMATKLGVVEAELAEEVAKVTPLIESEFKTLSQAGLKRAYVLIRMTDLQNQGTSWVIPLAKGIDSTIAKKTLENLISRLPEEDPGMRLSAIATTDSALLIASNEAQLKKLKASIENATQVDDELWKSIGNGTLGFAIVGDEDSRKVIRELMPIWPAPFEAITGELVANKLQWFGAELKTAKVPSLNIHFETTDEESAATIEKSINIGIKLIQEMPQTKAAFPESEHSFLFGGLAPIRKGTRVSISSEKLTSDMDRLGRAIESSSSLVRDSIKPMIRNYLSAIVYFHSQPGIIVGLSGPAPKPKPESEKE